MWPELQSRRALAPSAAVQPLRRPPTAEDGCGGCGFSHKVPGNRCSNRPRRADVPVSRQKGLHRVLRLGQKRPQDAEAREHLWPRFVPPGLWLPDSRHPDECSGVQWGDSACTTPTAPVMRPERLPPTHRPPSRARAACCFRSRGADVSRRLRPPCPAEPPDGLAWGEAVRCRPPERKARRTATPGPPAA